MKSETRCWVIRDIAANAAPPAFDAAKAVSPDQYYGDDVFSLAAMREYLSTAVYEKLLRTVHERAPLAPEIAGEVAHAMKEWALSKGATHYTHWFQPLNEATAEKHDAFLEPDGDGGVAMKFSEKSLVVGESDASSFPSGGLRSTFEARGSTAWDPTSPAFIRRTPSGATLCIPTAFCSYTGEALDKKTPLLRSIHALSRQIERMVALFEIEDAGTPIVNLGVEQEYFLVDRRFCAARPDLLQTGRTLFGAPPPKHHHYYGSIKPRVLAFMTEVDERLWRLGIPAKTRHNEAAPAQFEIASVHEEMNLASDHNMVVMDILREVADRHGFVCLLHEKPFDGVNGSGKHNNWSFGTRKVNFLHPGKDPVRNALFLTAVTAVIMAVDRHGELLRMATASSGNSYRLGANEAPPPVISIYLGEQLTRVIDEIEFGSCDRGDDGGRMRLFVDTLAPLPQDATDRNRTSPFAYTGNKFEFRSPGASQSCAGPNVVLNTIVTEALDEMLTHLESVPRDSFNEELQCLLKKNIARHRRIIFNGDNYTPEWLEEAKRRGLPILAEVREALATLLAPKNIELFEKYGVFTENELHSRHGVYLGEFHTRSRIEAELALTMARTLIEPAVLCHLTTLAEGEKALAGTPAADELKRQIDLVGGLFRELAETGKQLENTLDGGDREALPKALAALRQPADRLEKLVDDQLWPLPKYREMLFIY